MAKVSAWAKNLTDEEYVVLAFPVGDVAITQAYGEPRTIEFDVSYQL